MRLVVDPRDGRPGLSVGDLVEGHRLRELLSELSMTR